MLVLAAAPRVRTILSPWHRRPLLGCWIRCICALVLANWSASWHHVEADDAAVEGFGRT